MHRLALRLDDLCPAKRALFGHPEGLRPLVREHRADDLRDHVARSLDDDGVALADVLAVDVLFVVKRRRRDRHAPDLDRLQLRPRRECGS